MIFSNTNRVTDLERSIHGLGNLTIMFQKEESKDTVRQGPEKLNPTNHMLSEVNTQIVRPKLIQVSAISSSNSVPIGLCTV
jgi:hypothetical protein